MLCSGARRSRDGDPGGEWVRAYRAGQYSLLLTAYFATFDGQVITVRDGGSAWGCFGPEA